MGRCPNFNTLVLKSQGRFGHVVAGLSILAFVAQLFGDGSQLAKTLTQAAKEYSKADIVQELEAQTRAELERTEQALERLTRSIAEGGVIEQEEAKTIVQEFREKRGLTKT